MQTLQTVYAEMQRLLALPEFNPETFRSVQQRKKHEEFLRGFSQAMELVEQAIQENANANQR